MTSHDDDCRPQPRVHPALSCEQILELYRTQIRYLLAELHRIGWTPYSEQP